MDAPLPSSDLLGDILPVQPSGAPPEEREKGIVVIQRRLTSWDREGNPVVVTVPMIPKDQVDDVARAAISLPYEGPEPKYSGLTVLEVMMSKVAQRAGLKAELADIEMLLDRAIGKAKSVSESKNLNVNASYENYLKDLADKEAKAPKPPPQVHEAEVVPPPVSRTPPPVQDPFGVDFP